jgi:hypothetical protein
MNDQSLSRFYENFRNYGKMTLKNDAHSRLTESVIHPLAF